MITTDVTPDREFNEETSHPAVHGDNKGNGRATGRTSRMASAVVVPSAVDFVATRNDVANRLFHDRELACSAIAALRWRDVPRLCASHALSRALSALRALERARGFGSPDAFVIRFKGGGRDPVVRSNAVLRIVRS